MEEQKQDGGHGDSTQIRTPFWLLSWARFTPIPRSWVCFSWLLTRGFDRTIQALFKIRAIQGLAVTIQGLNSTHPTLFNS